MRLLGQDPAETATDVIESGDDFAMWYAATWPRVVRAVAVFTGDRSGAPDIAAEAFAKALERWDLPSRPADPTAWTVAVAVNLAKRRWRRERLHPSALWDGPRSVDQAGPDVDLWRAVAQLPAREREAIALRYAMDLTERAVAEAMGITPGAAAATLNSARTKLRRILTEDGHA